MSVSGLALKNAVQNSATEGWYCQAYRDRCSDSYRDDMERYRIEKYRQPEPKRRTRIQAAIQAKLLLREAMESDCAAGCCASAASIAGASAAAGNSAAG